LSLLFYYSLLFSPRKNQNPPGSRFRWVQSYKLLAF
jgi:hypothetical protein